MLEEFRNIKNDILSGKNLENYILAVLAIIIGILNVFGVAIASQSLIDTIVLAVLAVLIYGRTTDKRQFDALLNKTRIQGISEFYPDRSSFPSMRTFLEGAKYEILLVGVALTSVVHSQRRLLEEFASNGCKIRIAIWDPPLHDPNRKRMFKELEDLFDVPDVESLFINNVERLEHWYLSVNEESRKNIEIRTYRTVPTLSIFLIDKDYPNGLIHVEPIIYKTPPEKLASYRLRARDSLELYQVLREQYTRLWNEATPLIS